jgi:hypothetical protein
MARWASWDERRREIRQELVFAAAGIGDLVNTEPDEDEDGAPRCPECGWIWPESAERCAGCGYPEPIEHED